MNPIGYSKSKAQIALEKYDIDLLVAATPVNVFYTTGLPTLHVAPNPILYVLYNQFPSLSLVRSDGALCLITWMVYQSIDKFSWVSDVEGIASPKMALDRIAGKIESWELSNKTIGLERLMPRYQSEFLRNKFPNAKFIDADDVFLEMRLIKTEEEIQRIKRSTQIAEKAIETMINESKEGITDYELLEIARRTIVDSGAEGWDHLTMNIGDSDPEAPGTGTKMMPGMISRFDIGAIWKGYVSDVSREMVIGTPPEGAVELMGNMIQTQEFCVDKIKPGEIPKNVQEEAKKFFKTLSKRGRVHITAHGIGLECEEIQFFTPMSASEIPFEENMVLDIEVWQTFKNAGLVGIEDCYRITKSGCERLSSLDKEIFIK